MSKENKNIEKNKIDIKNDAISIDKKNFDRVVYVFFCAFTLIYSLLCLFLFYKQSLQTTEAITSLYESDLPYHISMAVDDGWFYSLTAFIYIALYKMAGGSTVLIAIFLGLVELGTVLLTEKLLCMLNVEMRAVSCGGALILNLIMPFYLKWAGDYRLLSYQSGNVWHNSTYICMKLTALVCLYLFIKYDEDAVKNGITLKRWFIFSIALALCTFVKPSFLTVFAPAFALKLLFNLLSEKSNRKKVFRNIVLWGITVIPACILVLWQQKILFGDSTGNGFAIMPFKSLSVRANQVYATIILSLAFPIIVFLCLLMQMFKDINTKHIFGDKQYIFAIVMAIVGFMEAVMFAETGSRASDGNFLWGYEFALFWLYLLSFKRWYGFIKEKRWVSLGISTLVLGYQFYCGIIFFSQLLSGISYLMSS